MNDTMLVGADLFRAVAGSFASGVTIITTGEAGDFHAMTASAFSSVSVEPPAVLVCIDRKAHTAERIERHGRFVVNLLSDGLSRLADACARRDTPETNGLVGVDYDIGPSGLPVLGGCLGFFDCRVQHAYDGGDHLIVVGLVESAGLGAESSPLLYFRRKYGQFRPKN